MLICSFYVLGDFQALYSLLMVFTLFPSLNPTPIFILKRPAETLLHSPAHVILYFGACSALPGFPVLELGSLPRPWTLLDFWHVLYVQSLATDSEAREFVIHLCSPLHLARAGMGWVNQWASQHRVVWQQRNGTCWKAACSADGLATAHKVRLHHTKDSLNLGLSVLFFQGQVEWLVTICDCAESLGYTLKNGPLEH